MLIFKQFSTNFKFYFEPLNLFGNKLVLHVHYLIHVWLGMSARGKEYSKAHSLHVLMPLKVGQQRIGGTVKAPDKTTKQCRTPCLKREARFDFPVTCRSMGGKMSIRLSKFAMGKETGSWKLIENWRLATKPSRHQETQGNQSRSDWYEPYHFCTKINSNYYR